MNLTSTHLVSSLVSAAQGGEIDAVFEEWKYLLGYERARLDQARRELIGARLADGYSVDDLKLAALGCANDDFSRGKNRTGRRFDQIGNIYHDAARVDEFMLKGEATLALIGERLRIRAERATAKPEALPGQDRRIISPEKFAELHAMLKMRGVKP
ncbi:MAG: hypothetical protein AB3X44_16215 [Leptothrix sp. (in: b-proteobacteria)]